MNDPYFSLVLFWIHIWAFTFFRKVFFGFFAKFFQQQSTLAMDSFGFQVGADTVAALEVDFSWKVSHAPNDVVVIWTGIFALSIPLVQQLHAVWVVNVVLTVLIREGLKKGPNIVCVSLLLSYIWVLLFVLTNWRRQIFFNENDSDGTITRNAMLKRSISLVILIADVIMIHYYVGGYFYQFTLELRVMPLFH